MSYQEVTRALIRRFGPTNLIKVHEQALSQLRLSKGQNIRELAQEVQRLVKQAYPDIIGPPRDRLAVKHLLNAIPDKDTAFYVREKNPTDVSEACTLYERYVALIHDKAPKRHGSLLTFWRFTNRIIIIIIINDQVLGEWITLNQTPQLSISPPYNVRLPKLLRE